MAASNEPLSPGSRISMADNAYDREWRQAEDLQDHNDSRLPTEAGEPVLNDVLSGRSGQSSRQGSEQNTQGAPIKVLTRPVSSGKDPAAGFSFTKAKPMQQFDFRRPKQIPVIPQPQDLPPPSRDTSTETHSHQSSILRDTNQADHNVVDATAQQGPSPKNQSTPGFNDRLPVPFPNATPAYTLSHNYPTPNTTSGPIQLNFSSTRAPSHGFSMSADDTLTNSHLEEKRHLLDTVSSNHSKPATTGAASSHRAAEDMRIVDQPQAKNPNHSRKATRDPLTSVSGTPRVTKPRRRKTKTGPAMEGPAPLNHKVAYTVEDLLRLLMYRQSQEQQELKYFRALQPQKEAEIQKLRDISDDLSNELQEVVQRETQTTNELSKIKANKPIWESKIKRLSDYVKGLTNDHNRLREDADDLHKRHKDISVVGKDLHDTLEDAQKSVEHERIRSQRLEDDARHRLETLAQTVQHQNTQLRSDETLLMVERDRNNRLEDQVSRITASHGQLLELFAGHRDTITSKIDNLMHQAQSIVPSSKASDSDSNYPIRPMLEQCVGILENLQNENTDTVKPEDLRKLNDTMDSFVEGIARSVEACEENSNSIEAGQKQLALAVQDQLRALSGNIFSEHALSEQIIDLREMKATIRERLQATESSLRDARQEVLTLRLKDQEQSRRVVALETVAARAQNQPAETPQSLLRIQELDSRNRDLQSEIFTLRKEATDLSSQLQQSSADAREGTERVTTIRDQLEAAREAMTRLQEEKSTSERQAIFEREQLRKELSKAANMQLASMQSEHMNIIQQLKLEKSPAEEKLKTVTRQFNTLRAEKEKAEKQNVQLEVSLQAAHSERDAVTGVRKALQLHLKEMETRQSETNSKNGDLETKLNKANDQLKAKDLENMRLQAGQSTRPSSSKALEQHPSVQGAQRIHNKHAQYRNSQHASISQSPFVQSANPQSSRHLTNRPPIVEDSQPTDRPHFVSLEDINLDDPFAGYAREGSQTIAGEDISLLFPSTPGDVSRGARAKNLDSSRNSASHKAIVSETQQRQHQSIVDGTPQARFGSKLQSQTRTYSKTGYNYTLPRSSAAISPTNISHRDTNIPSSQREASITRESTQPQGSVKDPRQGKRNTTAAGFKDTDLLARPTKMPKVEPPKHLGPVIEDSQSPLLNGRSRKMTRRASNAPKNDKFTRRFAQA